MSDPYGAQHKARRAAWAKHLRTIGPVLCRKEGCGRLVHANPADNWDGAPWQLGHGTAAHHGGDGTDSAPEHRSCNTSEGWLISQTQHPFTRRNL